MGGKKAWQSRGGGGQPDPPDGHFKAEKIRKFNAVNKNPQVQGGGGGLASLGMVKTGKLLQLSG